MIVERYRKELQAHARRLSSDGRADIVQQAFLSAFAALRSGTEVTHLRGWLYQIVRHAAIRLRSPRDVALEETAVAGAALEDVVQQRLLALSALSEVGRLPASQREALLATLQGRHRAEIATSMGLSEGAVRQLVHRARMSLRAAMTTVTPSPPVRWIAAARSDGALPDVAIGAGGASAGGLAMKLGALLASGVIAGGVVVETSREPGSNPASRAGGRVVRVQPRTAATTPGSAAQPLIGSHRVLGGTAALVRGRAVVRGGADHAAGRGARSAEAGNGDGRTERGGDGSQASPRDGGSVPAGGVGVSRGEGGGSGGSGGGEGGGPGPSGASAAGSSGDGGPGSSGHGDSVSSGGGGSSSSGGSGDRVSGATSQDGGLTGDTADRSGSGGASGSSGGGTGSADGGSGSGSGSVTATSSGSSGSLGSSGSSGSSDSGLRTSGDSGSSGSGS